MAGVLTIGGTEVDVSAIKVANSIDGTGMSVTATLPQAGGPLDILSGPQDVTADIGYGSTLVRVFTGSTRGQAPKALPYVETVQMRGTLTRASLAATVRKVFRSYSLTGGWTDKTIIERLLDIAGIDSSLYWVTGNILDGPSALSMGIGNEITLAQPASPLSLIKQILASTNGWIADQRGGQIRCATWPLQEGLGYATAFTYVEGIPAAGQYPIFDGAQRSASMDDVYNRVKVLGYQYPQIPPGDEDEQEAGGYDPRPQYTLYNRPHAVRIGMSPFIPNPPEWVTFPYESNLVQTDTHASSLANWLYVRKSGLLDTVTFQTMLNPYLEVGHVLALRIETLGITVLSPYVVTAYTHDAAGDKLVTTITCQGFNLAGAGGGPGESQDARPRLDGDISRRGTDDDLAIIFDATGSITKVDNPDGPFLCRWWNEWNGQTLQGLDETVYVVTPPPAEEFGNRIWLEVEDPTDHLKVLTEIYA